MSNYLKDGFIDEVKGCLGKEGDGSGQANVIESIKVNGVDQSVDSNKSVDIQVPAKTSDLDNDSSYMTESQVNSKITEGVDVILEDVGELNSNLTQSDIDLKMLGWTVPVDCAIKNSVSGNSFIQKVGRIDLSTLNWTYQESSIRFIATFYDVKNVSEWNSAKIYCDKYTVSIVQYGGAGEDKCIGVLEETIYLKDTSYTDESSLKKSLRGTYLYYELNTPIENSIDGNEIVIKLKNDLSPKKIELQNVDERVTIQDNGSFIINGFVFVNLLVTFNETLPQWSNFVRLPRPKGGNLSVHCENSVKLTIYSQDNLPGDCGTYDIVQSGTEIRLLVNYEVA